MPRIIVLNGIAILVLGFLIATNGQQNITHATTNSLTSTNVVRVAATNNTLMSSSSEEETNITPSSAAAPQANNTLLSSARLSTAMSHSSNACDQSLWDHVYHPSRLKVNDPCITVPV